MLKILFNFKRFSTISINQYLLKAFYPTFINYHTTVRYPY